MSSRGQIDVLIKRFEAAANVLQALDSDSSTGGQASLKKEVVAGVVIDMLESRVGSGKQKAPNNNSITAGDKKFLKKIERFCDTELNRQGCHAPKKSKLERSKTLSFKKVSTFKVKRHNSTISAFQSVTIVSTSKTKDDYTVKQFDFKKAISVEKMSNNNNDCFKRPSITEDDEPEEPEEPDSKPAKDTISKKAKSSRFQSIKFGTFSSSSRGKSRQDVSTVNFMPGQDPTPSPDEVILGKNVKNKLWFSLPT